MFQPFSVNIPKISTKEYDLRTYGAIGDGRTSNTDAFRKAIEAAAARHQATEAAERPHAHQATAEEAAQAEATAEAAAVTAAEDQAEAVDHQEEEDNNRL